MAFQPILSGCLKNNCTQLILTDITGVYDASTNPTGWEDASTLLAANVSKIEVTINFPDSTADKTVDITSQLPGTVTGEVEYLPIFTTSAYSDGRYTITYTITDASANTYQYILNTTFTCNVECCVDKMIAGIPEKLYSSAEDVDDAAYIEDAMLAEALLKGIYSAANCNNSAVIDRAITRLNDICKLNKCNCF